MRRHPGIRQARPSGIKNEQNCLATAKGNSATLHPGDDLETEHIVIKPFRPIEIAGVERSLAELTKPHRTRMGATAVASKVRLPLTSSDTMLAGDMQEIGKLLAIFGGLILLLGLALWSGFGAGWLGRLPGDIRMEREHSTFYFPIITCIIISIVVSLILSLFRR